MQGRILKFLSLSPVLIGACVAWASLFPAILHAQNSAAPFHNLPLCTANGTQSAPQLLADQAHGVWVIWEDARSARSALYCQRLDSLGHPQLPNNGIALATTSGKQTHFAATSDGRGGFIVVWQEVTNDDGDILAQRIAANGERLWGVEGKEVYRGNKEQGWPQVLAESSGSVYVFWHDERTGSQDLMGQRLNANGEKLWEVNGVELVNTRRTQTLGEAAVIPNRGFALSWQDESATPARVLVQHFDQSGKALWSAPVWVAQSSGEQSAPRMLLDASNTGSFALHLAWLDRRFNVANVYAQKLSADGAWLWGLAGIAAGRATGEQQDVQLLREGANGLFVVWEDARNDKGDIFAQRLEGEGKALWPAQGLALAQAEQGQFRARITADGQGGFMAAWEDERGSGTNIYAQRMNALGQAQWIAAGVVLTDHGKKNSQAGVLAISPKRAWSAWMDERNGSGDIYAQPLALDGKLENVPPHILSQPALQALAGSPYAYVIDAVDYDSDEAPHLQLVRAPVWLQLNHAAHKLEGTPGSRDIGEVQVELHAVDNAGGRAVQRFQLRIEVDTAVPQITSQPDTLAREDERYVYQINATDPDPQETLRYNLESNAAWLALSPQGELAGTPLNEHVGSYAITITATNSKGKSAQQQFHLRVQNVNDAPRIVSAPPPRAAENVAYSYRFAATDIDQSDSLTFAALLKPSWLLLAPNGAATGTPTRAHLADTLLTVYVVDRAGARDQKTYAIPIDLKNTRPAITSSPKTTAKEDSLYLYQIVIVDPDPNEKLTLTLAQAPQWLQLDSTNKQIKGTPRNEHVGTHTVSLEVRDRKGERDQQQFSVRVENTNDAPFFTSTPDTIAFVDSLYIYQPLAQDVDAGDRIALTVLAAPSWLTWEAATQTLRGSPKFTEVGAAQISLRAEDLNKAAAVQNVTVRVIDLGTPDQSAPTSPQSLTITPARWSATPQFTLRWQNPFDPSKIAGAYYKMGAPPNSARDGALVRSSASEPVREMQVQAAAEGLAPVYVWLMDGRDNVDHKTAARGDYHYDRTAPQAPADLRVLTSNGSAWVASDTINFVWQPATDALSGIASYTFNIDEKVVGQNESTATKFVFIAALKEGAHTCQVVAIDSAGNRRASLRVSFRIDRTPPRVTHTALDTIALGQTLTLRAQASDAASGVASLRVRYRTAGGPQFHERAMSFQGGEFVASLEAEKLHSAGLEYVISASDSAGNVALSAAPPRAVHAVVISSEQIAAPSATRGEYYQLVSLPYFIKPDSTLSWLQDDFGAYEQTAWRLYFYHPAHGNVEFGQKSFRNFAPGLALWLITAERKSFDVGPAHSISTAQDFVLELQPGWNLIATPFDFPTDWTAVQKPSLVESQLWSFDGKQYAANNTIMQPWQGYFVRNLNSAPEKILIPPIVAQASLPAIDSNSSIVMNDFEDTNNTPLYPPSRGEYTRTLPNDSPLEGGQGGVVTHSHNAQHDPMQWRLQLRVSNGAFADHENWLGVSAFAQEEWDELEWSEPPLAPGNFVALRFDQKAWQRFSGAFTTDFRPPSTHAQSWRFEILSAAAGQRVELTFERNGAAAHEKLFILLDEESRLAREIKFDGRSNASAAITFRSTATPHRFVLWAGTKEQLAQQGVAALLTPAQFELAPVYPNPARAQAGQEAMSTFRFSLPQASTVDLRVYDMLGRQVRDLVLKQFYAPGHHEIIWDGKDDHGNTVAVGVYWYRMIAPNFHATRKMMVLKE